MRVIQDDDDHVRSLKLTTCNRREQEKSAVKRSDAAIQRFNYERRLFGTTRRVTMSAPAPEFLHEHQRRNIKKTKEADW